MKVPLCSFFDIHSLRFSTCLFSKTSVSAGYFYPDPVWYSVEIFQWVTDSFLRHTVIVIVSMIG